MLRYSTLAQHGPVYTRRHLAYTSETTPELTREKQRGPVRTRVDAPRQRRALL